MIQKSETFQDCFFSLVSKCIIVIIYTALFLAFIYFPYFINLVAPQKTLNILTFTETFSPEAIEKFEQLTGIHVNVTYAEIDEQIYAKFKVNEGEGYDIVNISDFLVYTLSNANLLRRIDHKKISNISRLDHKLMRHAYDLGNDFSLPHKWYVYGLVYDKTFFNVSPNDMSYEYLFKNPEYLYRQRKVIEPYNVCMLDDGRDAVFITAIYLFGHAHKLGIDDFKRIGQLLVEQKKWVEAYTIYSAQYFLFTGITPIALMSSNYMKKILDNNNNRFEFSIPKEGSALIIENLAIPMASKKVDWAHQFIDFMLSDESALCNSTEYGYNSSNKSALKAVDRKYRDNEHLFPTDEGFKRLVIPLLSPKYKCVVEDIWLAVGFA